MSVFLAIMALAVTCLVVMLARNYWVFDRRIEIINKDHRQLDQYLSYDEMMLRFWVWNIEKLKKKVEKI